MIKTTQIYSLRVLQVRSLTHISLGYIQGVDSPAFFLEAPEENHFLAFSKCGGCPRRLAGDPFHLQSQEWAVESAFTVTPTLLPSFILRTLMIILANLISRNNLLISKSGDHPP